LLRTSCWWDEAEGRHGARVTASAKAPTSGMNVRCVQWVVNLGPGAEGWLPQVAAAVSALGSHILLPPRSRSSIFHLPCSNKLLPLHSLQRLLCLLGNYHMGWHNSIFALYRITIVARRCIQHHAKWTHHAWHLVLLIKASCVRLFGAVLRVGRCIRSLRWASFI
jgi:hypothetical protein